MSKYISLFAKGTIVGLKLVGTLEERIADILQDEGIPCDRSTISKIWKKYKEQGIYEDQRQYKSRRSQSLDEQDINQLIEYTRNNPLSSRKELQESEIANPKEVTGQTLFKYLKENSFEQKVIKCIISITQANKEQRVIWAKQMLRSRRKQLKNCIYSDETWISIEENYKSRQWVDKNDPNQKLHVNEQARYPKKLLIWGAIDISGPLSIQIIDGTIDQQQYMKILQKFFIEDRFIERNYHFNMTMPLPIKPYQSNNLYKKIKLMNYMIGLVKVQTLTQSKVFGSYQNKKYLNKQKNSRHWKSYHHQYFQHL